MKLTLQQCLWLKISWLLSDSQCILMTFRSVPMRCVIFAKKTTCGKHIYLCVDKHLPLSGQRIKRWISQSHTETLLNTFYSVLQSICEVDVFTKMRKHIVEGSGPEWQCTSWTLSHLSRSDQVNKGIYSLLAGRSAQKPLPPVVEGAGA